MENLKSLPNNPDHQKITQIPNKPTIDQNKPIKVKYISSPMMVKANNESEFRAIVQKLTGQHSSPDDAFHQSLQQFNQVFYPPTSTLAVASFDPKDYYAFSSTGHVFDPTGVAEGHYWRDEDRKLI
ncbi:unnamed protein product [Citrullus colocynthis]|uniref:VQ domain-containing protein n=1 Tax=Citrullus colocynthis TaxID=252529 RepID=A0ABP0Y804_9ROSI